MRNADLELAIPIWLARYLKGEVALDDLRAWFAPATWEVELTEPRAAGLVARVDALLMQYNDGEVSEPQLQRKFAPMALPAMKVEVPVSRPGLAAVPGKLAQKLTPKRPVFS
jgi:hypothetical protein